ncbi:MAG TPA: aminotransferase class III-fold pyridoxal phosphate-dependent enzyme [Anaerolineae bacterium]|nr:aminotransferase class III-fold pyridoxal phosphate-dependent enzyme [Anaerolineae bacterium]
MDKSAAKALSLATWWLEVTARHELPEVEAQRVIATAVDHFSQHVNRGWLAYRKSVTEAGQWAATEWTGEGALLRDVLGREYIDCLGGYGLLSLGWSHPRVVDAVRAQLDRVPMPSLELISPARGVLSALMAHVTPGDIQYAFFAASGAEAVEGAIKLAKLYTRQPGFIVATRAFHGKTMGALSMMGKSEFRDCLMPLYGGPVYHVPFGDADAVERQLDTCHTVGVGIAAVLMEPVQGEAGAIVPPDNFWPRLRALCDQYGVLLIADEVQTGLGRTGTMWAVDHWHVAPDILCSGKALGGGVMPVSAFCATPEVWQVLMEPNPFMHTNTTGGNPLACAAAIATLQVILEERLWERAAVEGAYFKEQLEVLAARYPHIYHRITGLGLMIGQHFHDAATGYRVAAGLFKRGVLVAGTLTNARTVRIEPPLVITRAQIDAVLDRLDDTLREVSAGVSPGPE